MLLKPKNETVERVLTDCYNMGRDAVLQAAQDYFEGEVKNNDMFKDFYRWYKLNEKDYDMKFRVGD